METILETTPDITLRSPTDLLSAVPYLLGFAPEEGIVIIGMSTKRIGMTVRAPLPAVDEPVSLPGINAEVLRRNKVDAAIVVGYGTAERVTRCVDHVVDLFDELDIDLIEGLRVTEGRYWSYTCPAAQCCPAEGTPVNRPDSAVDAAFTVGGMQALPNRSAVTAQLSPVVGSERAAVTRAVKQVEKFLSDPQTLLEPFLMMRTTVTAIRERFQESGSLPNVLDTVRLAIGVTEDPRLRAEAMCAVDQYGGRQSTPLWLWATRHAPARYRAEPAALLGFAAWRTGNGVLAGEAIRLALTDDASCHLAVMLARLLEAGLPPSSLPKLPKGGLV